MTNDRGGGGGGGGPLRRSWLGGGWLGWVAVAAAAAEVDWTAELPEPAATAMGWVALAATAAERGLVAELPEPPALGKWAPARMRRECCTF